MANAAKLRVLVVGLLLAATLSPAQSARVYTIGFVIGGSPDASTGSQLEAFRQQLGNLGYVEGQNVKIHVRWHPGERPDLLPDIANELVRSGADILIGANTPAILALKRATKTIPIVMVAPGDPVGTGLIESLGRPGGNVTGLAWMTTDMQGKRLQLLKEILPKMSRVADVWNPLNPATRRDFIELEGAARTLGISVLSAQVKGAEDLEGAFNSVTRAHADAVIVQTDPFTIQYRKKIADLATRNHLPSMFYMRDYVVDGGFISYGASLIDQFRRTAGYVDRILKGARPADLPVEQPTKFELIINLKTAKVLGITIPQSILLRANEVIQ
jgi:putative ABC transport system substrate-binding protein